MMIRIICENDAEALQWAVESTGKTLETVTVAVVKNTLELSEMYVSQTLAEQMKNNSGIELLNGPLKLHFDNDGRLICN